MASNISIEYVYTALNIIAEHIKTNEERDLSFENFKNIVNNSNILKNKLKITNNSKVGGWHAFVSVHRKDKSLKRLGELWNKMSEEEKKPYNEKALNMREKDKLKKKNNIIRLPSNIIENKIDDNKLFGKKINAWVLFKKKEIRNGNLDINNIKEKYKNLSSEELDNIKKLIL